MTFVAGSGARVLLTSTASDAHTWNLVYLQLHCEELGHRVVNLGSCVPVPLLLDHARRLAPDVVVVSSVNGHGHLDGLEIARAVRRRPELRHLPLVIGGMLGVDGAGVGSAVAAGRRRRLLDAGFDHVLDGRDLDRLTELLDAVRVRQVS